MLFPVIFAKIRFFCRKQNNFNIFRTKICYNENKSVILQFLRITKKQI